MAGGRTPFVKAGKGFKDLGPLRLAKHAVTGLLGRHDIDPAGIDAIVYGTVIPEPGKPNLAREIVLATGLHTPLDHAFESFAWKPTRAAKESVSS